MAKRKEGKIKVPGTEKEKIQALRSFFFRQRKRNLDEQNKKRIKKKRKEFEKFRDKILRGQKI